MKLETALALVMVECDRAEKLHSVWPWDHIHQAAIIAEEAGECLQTALNHREGKDSKQPMITEAVHTAAMALRFLKNIESDDAND
jgi:hypothetical protein